MKTYICRVALLAIQIILFNSIETFAHFGSKGPYGGSISCSFVYDTTVYLGTFEGGVYESTSSKLVSWRARPVGLQSGKITALAHTGKFLYAGTADSGVFIFNGFVGQDRYCNKISTGLTNLKITSLLAINETTLMVGTVGAGVFLSTNSGTSWTAVNTGLQNLNITGLVKAGSRVLAISDEGVSFTINHGTTWSSFNDVNTANILATALSYNVSTDELMIVNAGGVFVANNASTALTATFTSAYTGLPGVISIRSISNNGSNWFLATDNGVFTTATSSISWTEMNTGLTTLDVTTVLPFKSNFICGTNDKGFFKSTNPFVSWSVMNSGLNSLSTYAMATGGELFVAVATSQGVYVSKDLAALYVRSNNGLGDDSLNVTDLAIASFGLYAATKNSGIFFSPDSGKTWSTINNGLTNLSIQKLFIINDIRYAIDFDGTIYFAPSNTTQWSTFQDGLPADVKPTSLSSFGTKLLLSTYGDGVFIRDASNNSWVGINTGLSNLKVTAVTSSGTKIFAGTDGSGVFVSDATTINWQATAPLSNSFTNTMNLDGSRIQAMASVEQYNKEFVFASFKGGVLVSYDNGATWVEGVNQFNLPSYTDINKISFVTTRVFVTTEINGLYSNALSELSKVITGIWDASANEKAVPISPNPTKGEFKLDLSSIAQKITTISIYNSSGRLMDEYINEEEFISVYYSSGLYIVQVRTEDNKVYNQKLIIE